ncbi:DEAD/DEAH box helicase [Acerihabitans sp. KWT182]|uniref:DEAD/DEAH box helicase n=1 Tax=Acerihabitans sp. KWT182 TaxID=3157919 RepID=A0AAU7Q7P5_9GAMM
MSNFLEKLASNIFNSDGYKKSTNLLFSAYVKHNIGADYNVEHKEVRELLTAAQIFYKSNDEITRREGTIVLAMLLDVSAKKFPAIIPIANSLFSTSGDFPNISLLQKRYPEVNFRYSLYHTAQIEFHKEINTVKDLNFILTDFQGSLWNDLISGDDVITVAPTSAGKTHIILSYLINELMNSSGAFAAILVPTRALIAEVSGKIHQLAKEKNIDNEVEICTIPRDGSFKDKTFFVMTQERLHEVLQRGDIYFNYLFIDEAHNITDKSRGVLLHLTIEKIIEDSVPQIIISMPSSNYQNSFSTIFKDVEFKKRNN